MNIRHLFACLLLSALATAAAASDGENLSSNDAGAAGQPENSEDAATINDDALVVDIVDKEIHDIYGKAIGDVDRVVRTITGKQAVIGLYNSLKEIALPLSDLHWKEGEIFVRLLEGDIARMDDVDLDDAIELEPGDYYRYEMSRFEERSSAQ